MADECSRGFDRDWSFMWGCHNHYAYEPQFEPQTNADDAVSVAELKLEAEQR